MKIRSLKTVLCTFLCIMLTLSSVPLTALAEGTLSDDIVVLYTNDVHTYIDGSLSYDVISAIKKDLQKELATKVVESKKWEPDSSVTSAAIIDGITAAKSLVKNAKDNCATSWSVTESSAETPGY